MGGKAILPGTAHVDAAAYAVHGALAWSDANPVGLSVLDPPALTRGVLQAPLLLGDLPVGDQSSSSSWTVTVALGTGHVETISAPTLASKSRSGHGDRRS